MILAHRIQLDPTKSQAEYFSRAAGTARFVWNWALAEWNRQYKAGEKPKGTELKKQFNAIKYKQFPWLKEVHRDAHAQPFANLQKAFSGFFQHKGKRPRFKCKGVHDAFYVSNDKFSVLEKTVKLPIVGTIKLTEQLRFVGKIMGAAVSRSADRWFISIQVDVGEYTKQRAKAGVVGVDLGLKNALTLSTGEVIDSPKPLKKVLKRLRRLSRRHSRKRKGSSNRRKATARLAKLHWKVKCQRHDFLHKVTTRLCRENQTVVIEDLAVKNMMKNRKLSRAISDMGWHEFRRQFEYKAMIYGISLVEASRFFPSSKTCSRCGHVKEALSLSERTFTCSQCGFSIDRDLNAAKNLATLGFRESYACGPEGSDSVRKNGTKPRRVEAGTMRRDRLLQSATS